MTTASVVEGNAHSSAVERPTGTRDRIEPRVLRAMANLRTARTEQFNTANRAILELGKPGWLD